jgi:broad specificity phosphatase PhoE
MGWPNQIVLIRHGESKGNVLTADERAASEVATHEVELTDRGIWQAEVTRDWLVNIDRKFDAIYSSYYKRTLQTAGILFPDRKPIVDSRLQEAQRGVYHHMTHAQVEEAFPGEARRMRKEGLYHFRPIGGENWPDMEIRVRSFLETLRAEHSRESIAIVCHGNWLVVFEMIVQGWTIEEGLAAYKKTKNCGVTIHYPYDPKSKRVSNLCTGYYNFAPWEGQEEPKAA